MKTYSKPQMRLMPVGKCDIIATSTFMMNVGTDVIEKPEDLGAREAWDE